MDRAATTARISTSLWTQVEGGTQYKRGRKVAASTTAETLQAMASAVGLEVGPLLDQVGLDPVEPNEPATAPRAGVIDLSDLSESELSNIAAYVAGLRAGRRS